MFNSAPWYSTVFLSNIDVFQESRTLKLEQVAKISFRTSKQRRNIFIDRSLRRHKPSLAIMSSAFCLAMSNLVLGAGSEQVAHHGICNFLTFLWHWMFLSTWFWFCLMANDLKRFVEKVKCTDSLSSTFKRGIALWSSICLLSQSKV